MKDYTAKTLDDAIKLACADQGVEKENLIYEVKEEKKGLFKKSATISVYELADAIQYGAEYLKKVLDSLEIQSNIKTSYKEEVIRFTIDSDHNSILIGHNGNGLKAITDLTRLAIGIKFKRRYRLLVDISDYKHNKYKRITFAAKKAAKEVLATKVTIKLDPMTSDERRVVHKVLTKYSHIETESVGEGKARAVTIKYVD